ncbi:hypothetical protein GCM10023335_35110 [Streptomyces siamensis]|uniref:Uncharacterized protein n=1 Tax=Streptomyces siamensis TaxID=1274986 RepID=A0ABP9IWP6_9ACTN
MAVWVVRGAVAEPALASAGIDVIIPATTAAAPHRAAARFFIRPPRTEVLSRARHGLRRIVPEREAGGTGSDKT